MWEAGGNSPVQSQPGLGTLAASRGKRQGKKHREKVPVRGMQSSGSDAQGRGAAQTSRGSLRPSATGTETQRPAGHQPAAGSRRASYHPQQKQRVPPAPGEMPGAQKAALYPQKTILGQSSWHGLSPYTTDFPLLFPPVLHVPRRLAGHSPCLPASRACGWTPTSGRGSSSQVLRSATVLGFPEPPYQPQGSLIAHRTAAARSCLQQPAG